MTVKHQEKPLTRRAERARFRQGPPWTIRDALPPLVVILLLLAALASPALVADVGDTVVGPRTFIPELGTTWSGLLHIMMRMGIVLGVGYILVNVREAPYEVRLAWMGVAVGLIFNYARAVYTGSESSLSFLVLQVSLLVLVHRLSTRPTVWAQVKSERERADAAEQEVKRLNEAMKGLGE